MHFRIISAWVDWQVNNNSLFIFTEESDGSDICKFYIWYKNILSLKTYSTKMTLIKVFFI